MNSVGEEYCVIHISRLFDLTGRDNNVSYRLFVCCLIDGLIDFRLALATRALSLGTPLAPLTSYFQNYTQLTCDRYGTRACELVRAINPVVISGLHAINV